MCHDFAPQTAEQGPREGWVWERGRLPPLQLLSATPGSPGVSGLFAAADRKWLGKQGPATRPRRPSLLKQASRELQSPCSEGCASGQQDPIPAPTPHNRPVKMASRPASQPWKCNSSLHSNTGGPMEQQLDIAL